MTTPALLALDVAAAVVLVTAWVALIHRRISAIVNLYVVQSVALSSVAFLVAYLYAGAEIYEAAFLTLGVNAVLIPWVLGRVMADLRVEGEVEMLVSVRTSALAGLGLLILADVVVAPLSGLAAVGTGGLLPIALAVLLLGFFLLVTRRKAITQVMGLLMMENGVFLAGLALTYGLGLIIELGVAANLLVLAVVGRLLVYRMKESFDSVDVAVLRTLKE